MSEASGLRLGISPDSTRFHLRILSVAHLLALLASLIASLPWPLRLSLVFSIIVSWIFQRRKFNLNSGENRASIAYTEQDGWSFWIDAGEPVRVELLASSIALRWITILHFKTDRHRFQSFVI
ncbi:MAG: hypothetical protein ACRERS_09860, partial [Methylococcales bacterium]